MGGSAFENFGLYTPRIPSATYKHVLQKIKLDLSDLFARVECAIEAPEKRDHGDLDILVVPRCDTPMPSMSEIASRLGADRWFSSRGTTMHHFAVPWPEDYSGDGIDSSKSAAQSVTESIAMSRPTLDLQDSNNTSKSGLPNPTHQRHIQIDLIVAPDEISLRWTLFVSAHGDVINIIASMIRHKGITINNEALYLRFAGLDEENRKVGRMEVTRDPDQVLKFLGLDADRFWKTFTTLNDMMEYIATCHFLDPKRFKQFDGDGEEQDSCAVTHAVTKIKPHYSRPSFKYWYDVFLPAHEDDPPGARAHLSREETLDFTFDFFGEETRQQYFRQKREAEVFIGKGRLWADVRKQITSERPDIPEKEMLDIIKALKQEVTASPNSTINESAIHNDTSGTLSPRQVQQAFAAGDLDTVIAWSVENYVAVLARYRQRVKASGGSSSVSIDHRKANPFSRTDVETYSSDDDKVITIMKNKGRPWGEILSVLGKKSRSQLQAHWKNDLNSGSSDL